MAIDRFIMQDDRVLISKAGATASLTMADENKIFDSNWDFTGTLLARGICLDPATPTGPGAVDTATNTPYSVAVPLPFTPRDIFIQISAANSQNGLPVWSVGDWSNTVQPTKNLGSSPKFYFDYASGVLSFTRLPRPGSSPVTYLMRDWSYRVYSV